MMVLLRPTAPRVAENTGIITIMLSFLDRSIAGDSAEPALPAATPLVRHRTLVISSQQSGRIVLISLPESHA